MYQIQSVLYTHPGRKRQNNQDYIGCFEPPQPEDLRTSGCLYILADGVGGESKGEKASQYAVKRLLYEYYRSPEIPSERLRRFIRKVGNEIYEYSQRGEHPFRMATTIAAVVMRGNTMTVANVGDSRVYLIREGGVKQITRDHSIVGEMIRDGSLTEAESYHAKVRNSLTRSLGGEPDPTVDVHEDIPLKPGDKILLCSDGLTRYATRKDIAELIQNGTVEEIAKRMIDYANQQGGADNISVILLAIGNSVDEVSFIRDRAEQQPEQVDWDTLATEPAAVTKIKPRKRTLPFPIFYLYGAAMVAMALFLALGGYIAYNLHLFDDLSSVPPGKPTSVLTPALPKSGNLVSSPTPLSYETMVITRTPTFLPSATHTPTPNSQKVTSSPSPTVMKFPLPTSTVSFTPIQQFNRCQYTIGKGRKPETGCGPDSCDVFVIMRDVFNK